MPWTWYGPPVYRYRDERGQFASKSTVDAWGEAAREAHAQSTRDLAAYLAESGDLTGWQEEMRARIKASMIQQATLAAGGRSQMTPARWGQVGGLCAKQYHYLDEFAARIASGAYSEAQIGAYSEMYLRSTREVYERSTWQLHSDQPWVRWTLSAAEHCEDCIALASLGWQRRDSDPFGGCFPGSGCTACLTNCACTIEYATEPK